MAYGPKPKPRGIFQPEDIPPWNCTKCKRSLPVSAYYKHNGAAYGYSKECKECQNAKSKAYFKANPGYSRAQKLRVNFGLTPADVDAMLAAQGGGCAVCLTDSPGTREWHVDHDHACCPARGKSCGECIRGILCHHCNVMLGNAKDDPEILARAIRYLGGESWRGVTNSSEMLGSSTK